MLAFKLNKAPQKVQRLFLNADTGIGGRKMAQINPKDLILIPQSPRAAVFGLFLGDVANETFDPERLTIVQRANSASLKLGLALEVAIIGESHYVRLTRAADNKTLFTELLACVDPSQFGYIPTVIHSFNDNERLELSIRDAENGLLVETITSIRAKVRNRRNFVPPSFDKDSKDLTIRLKQSFPGPLKPRTIVSVALDENGMDIRTVHEYLTEDHYVEPITSETRVTFRP